VVIESTRASLATLMESRGAGGRSRKASRMNRPAPLHAARARTAMISAVTERGSSNMAGNVLGHTWKRKGFGSELLVISY
jgi:hypothetical protein